LQRSSVQIVLPACKKPVAILLKMLMKPLQINKYNIMSFSEEEKGSMAEWFRVLMF